MASDLYASGSEGLDPTVSIGATVPNASVSGAPASGSLPQSLISTMAIGAIEPDASVSGFLPDQTTVGVDFDAMAPGAATLFDLVLSKTWQCLEETPVEHKNSLFARFFKSKADIDDVATTASLEFAPGLLNVLESPTPPTADFFKSLPVDSDSPEARWAVYTIVLEKEGFRPIIYIGSGTSSSSGVHTRLKQYYDRVQLPVYVEQAINDGFGIVSNGLLCWIPRPTLASKVPIRRLLIIAFEATFSFLFWSMKARMYNRDYHGMSRICLWNSLALPYQGACSHSALYEGIRGQFDMTDEQLEAYAVDMETKRLELKAQNATNYHYKQMLENYDEYMGNANARVYKSRALNPGRDRLRQAERAAKAHADKSYYCKLCDISYSEERTLKAHLETAKHLRKEKEAETPSEFFCPACNLGYANKSNFTRHEKNDRHQKAVAAMAALAGSNPSKSTRSIPDLFGMTTSSAQSSSSSCASPATTPAASSSSASSSARSGSSFVRSSSSAKSITSFASSAKSSSAASSSYFSFAQSSSSASSSSSSSSSFSYAQSGSSASSSAKSSAPSSAKPSPLARPAKVTKKPTKATPTIREMFAKAAAKSAAAKAAAAAKPIASAQKMNPETVSTDYDEADRLYFENINLETVIDIYELENSSGVLMAMGGQTPQNIALPLHRLNIKVLGTSPEMIDNAENRYKFSRMLDRIEVDQPTWKELTSFEEAKEFCNKVSYPVLVRPSYVLSGAAMNTVYSEPDLEAYLKQASEVSREHPVVITKYIENAKEIEMDAVAKDGVMVGHFISEHVENAGVHSGDATLILPPQDLEATTIKRIEEATRKIGMALNITGPYNIQFIAKDNDIKVIECNVRASRSFPFVSKVMGVDLIELATKAIMDIPFEAYAPDTLVPGTVGVKVPQFSFSRLSGADPVLGVEMASTGEVASFGRDKYEAYLKALVSTGFKLPKRNILLSIGSYKDKNEMLPSVKKLQALGYKLFATAGTADFLMEHGIRAQYLEILPEEDQQKSEYSLTQHLANNMIDLYINLPSSNRYRRPANYMSKGYKTRRMAVDYQTPLVTNVKNAKILIEAIARNYDMEITTRDYQTSHRTVVLPGLVNIQAFLPGVATAGSNDLQTVTEASIAAGFTMIRVMPVGLDSCITDARTLDIAQANSRQGAGCDYNFSVAATSSNAEQISLIAGEVGSLFIPFNHLNDNISKVAAVTAHFDSWPTYKPIITDAKVTDLASILLLASLHSRNVHVTNVTTKEDIRLIAMSKDKGLTVTCDVSVYSLFVSQKEYPECSFLPTAPDQTALWEHLSTIDVFSIGSVPYQLAHALGEKATPAVGISDALPLLFSAVADGRLTVDDIKTRLHDNPVRIFELHEQVGASVEVEIDRPYAKAAGPVWSPFVGKVLRGSVQRVIFNDKTACLDGEPCEGGPLGKDMSSHVLVQVPPSPAVKGIQSPLLSPMVEATDRSKARRTSSLLGQQPGPRAFSRQRALEGSALTNQPSRTGPTEEYGVPLYPQPSISPSLQSLLARSPFKNQHVISVKQFTRSDLHVLFTVAQEMRLGVQREGVLDILKGRVLCTMFYEPSTRTSTSFDAAMQRLGGRTIAISTQHSSTVKGESLQDSLRTLACYGDAIVLRHPEENSVDIATKYCPVPVINGGNGSKEHPTQAFLDLFTIREELGTVTGLTITFTGDLLHGRTVHSLCKLLQYYDVQVQLVSPPQLALPADIRDMLKASGQLVLESTELTPDIVAKSDVLYCTRVQKERFSDLAEYERLKDTFIIDNKTLKAAKPSMVVMHPLPRNAEVAGEVDFDQRAAYFRQMRYGLYCRMALLALVMAP
ncbi:hypothetical protein V496_00178 [Pseudogymnoascus sp. VKM F-4515 (FW-2607)]|nr:hypothetical protein V496_00178 [Pseudogymnoascus sp. VKM F-4515 (FW-2607)]KFY99579.1 hypothetical protein V498_00646 [Pseudogymnoascus sp. VKM F-4517 (FW-2822)]